MHKPTITQARLHIRDLTVGKDRPCRAFVGPELFDRIVDELPPMARFSDQKTSDDGHVENILVTGVPFIMEKGRDDCTIIMPDGTEHNVELTVPTIPDDLGNMLAAIDRLEAEISVMHDHLGHIRRSANVVLSRHLKTTLAKE